MGTGIIMMVIFLFTDIMAVGICMFAYVGKEEYREGMIFGVHIPKEKADEKTVQDMVEVYKKKYKRFQCWNMFFGILVCGLAFVGIGVFMAGWAVWFTEYIVGLYCLVYGTHRKMYELKVKNGWILQKKKEVMSTDTEMIEIDDDVYWKNGWYSNPHDKRLFVPDRMCSTNYSMNMAKTSAKIWTAVIGAIVIGCVIWVAVLLIEFATTEVTVHMENGMMDVRAASYDCQIYPEQIVSVKLLDEMPEDNFYRNNGGDTEKYLIGHFRGKETGKCMMFLYKEETPILEIRLKDMTIFLNSEDEEETEEWYKYARDSVTY